MQQVAASFNYKIWQCQSFRKNANGLVKGKEHNNSFFGSRVTVNVKVEWDQNYVIVDVTVIAIRVPRVED